jgi:sugar phosphate isomerase/epimerase
MARRIHYRRCPAIFLVRMLLCEPIHYRKVGWQNSTGGAIHISCMSVLPRKGFRNMYTRRDFGKVAISALSLAGLRGAKLSSTVGGVRLGAISYCFRGLSRPSDGDYIDTIVKACVECGVGNVELTSVMVEPPNTLPGGGRVPPDTPENRQMREELRKWRLSEPLSRFKEIRNKFDDAGINLFAYVMTFAEDFPAEEIEAVFHQTKALGAGIIGTNQTTVGLGPKLAPYAEKYKIDLSFHNHAMVDNPNEVASVQSFEKLFAMSKRFKANLDIGHFVAGNNDPVVFIEQHHDRITHIHLKDRKRNNGPNMPWGDGETPLKPVLRLVKEKHYPIYCIIEYEYKGTGTPIEETKKCMGFIKQVLA